MMAQKIYIITGNPIPLARGRIANRRVYDSQKEMKLITGIHIRNQHGELPFYEGPVHLDIYFFFEIPKSFSGKKANAINAKPHHIRPDIDNLIKYYLDVSNGILFKDDGCISSISAFKCYDKLPRTEFKLTEIK
jgi:Holliday junction resolvase RusA-like endonuclease